MDVEGMQKLFFVGYYMAFEHHLTRNPQYVGVGKVKHYFASESRQCAPAGTVPSLQALVQRLASFGPSPSSRSAIAG